MSGRTSPKDSALRLLLTPSVAAGVRVKLHKPLRFEVTLSARSIRKCTLTVSANRQAFRDHSQKIDLAWTPGVAKWKIAVEVSLTPIALTAGPAWISVVAKAPGVVSAGGFSATVV